MVYNDPYDGYRSDFVFTAGFSWGNVGERSTCFGVITYEEGQWDEDPPTYHTYGPDGLFWDGHVETVQPPPVHERFALRKHLTRNGRPEQF